MPLPSQQWSSCLLFGLPWLQSSSPSPEDDTKDVNEAGMANTENDLELNGMDEYKDENEDEDDEMKELMKALTKAEKDTKGSGQGEDYIVRGRERQGRKG